MPGISSLAKRSGAITAVAAVAVGVLLVLAGLAGYASVRRDRIAPATTVAGIDLGGMTAARAHAALERSFATVLAHPVVARRGERHWTLTPRRSLVHVDISAIVADALRRSREGDALRRGLRQVVGLRAELPLRLSWSREAVRDFVRRIRRDVGHPARAADVDFTRRGLRRTPARPGLAVPERRLRRAIEAALAAPAEEGRVDVPVTVTRRPRVTLADLRARYRWLIGIDRPDKRLRLYRRLKLLRTYRIAVGAIGHKTAPGRYEIQTKVKNPPWNVPEAPWAGELAGRVIPPGDPQNPLKARWMGFHDGEGIHGTADIGSLGEAASHGCIRMSVPDVKDLYRRVPLHTPVFIV
jgi:lipoprotein-anchoring transpeptidase ErfK/SrfK